MSNRNIRDNIFMLSSGGNTDVIERINTLELQIEDMDANFDDTKEGLYDRINSISNTVANIYDSNEINKYKITNIENNLSNIGSVIKFHGSGNITINSDELYISDTANFASLVCTGNSTFGVNNNNSFTEVVGTFYTDNIHSQWGPKQFTLNANEFLIFNEDSNKKWKFDFDKGSFVEVV